MSQVLVNAGANLVGKGIVALANVVALPIYFALLGPEACGILGFFQTFLVLATILDLGIGLAFNKTLAQYKEQASKKSADLLVTLEVVYGFFGVAIGLLFGFFSNDIASSWLSFESMSLLEVDRAIQLIALCLTLYWPYLLYSNGLMGLECQTQCNLIQVAMTVVRIFGAVGGVYFMQVSVHGVLIWYAITFFLQSFWARAWIRIKLNVRQLGEFSWGALLQIRHFAKNMGLLSLTAVVLMQVDKIVLSKTLALEEYGFYTMMASLASGLILVAGPVFMAVFPVLTSAVSSKDRVGLKREFLQGSCLMALLVVPIASVFVLFSSDILQAWLGSHCLVGSTERLVFSLLVLGFTFNALLLIPYALQLAYGWTQLNLIQNLIAIAVLLPALLFISPVYQGLGAAFCWFVLNLCYYFVGMPFVFRKVLRSERSKWYLRATGLPLGIGFAIGGASKLLLQALHAPQLVAISVTYLSLLGAIGMICRREIQWSFSRGLVANV